MGMAADKKFDWIAGLSVAAGAAVIIPALMVTAVSLVTVAISVF